MRRFEAFLIVAIFMATLSGCILGKSPNIDNVMVEPGVAKTFSVTVFPPGGTYTWTLDGTPLSNATNSYQYTPTGGQHVLAVQARHFLGTDTHEWNITDIEAMAPVGPSGGTVAVTDPSSPIAGTQADIPSGSLGSTATITISQANAPSGIPGQQAGPCINFGPDGLAFSIPAELTLPYPDEDNDGLVDGIGVSEDLVKAYWYNDSTSAWEEVPIIGRDFNANIVRVNVIHFSKYIIIVPDFITWQRMWGGSGDEELFNVQVTQDGGYIAAGGIFNPTLSLIKFDSRGQIIWQRYDMGYLIEETSDGGFITINNDSEIYKLDPIGNVIGMTGIYIQNLDISPIKPTSDGGYIISGNTQDNIHVYKLDSSGSIQWNRTFGGLDLDIVSGFNSVQQTSDGGYIVAGFSNSTDIPGVTNHGGVDSYIIRLNSSGEIIWQKMFGGSGNDISLNIQLTSDSGYIVAGVSESTDIPGVVNHGSFDIYVLRLDAEGDLIWQKMYGGSGDDSPTSTVWPLLGLNLMQDNGFVVSGTSKSTDIPGVINHGFYDSYIIRATADGDVVWQRMYGGSGLDFSFSIIQTQEEGFIAVGISDSTDIEGVPNHGGYDAYVLKLDPDGNFRPEWLRDSDGDGLLDALEMIFGTDPFDADMDDDGIMDGVEDSNRNGIVDIWETNPRNIDTDGDGIQDGTELSVTLEMVGPDTDLNIFQPDLDPTTTTSPILSDSDYDGIPDGVEDSNHNGMVDPGESDPNLPNSSPVANAGSDQLVVANALVTLDGSGSTDPDNNIASYLWQQTSGPTVTLSDPSAVMPTFTASVAEDSELTFSLTVTDTGNLTSTDTCTVRINYFPTIAWQRMFGGSGEDNGLSIQQTFDGGYIVAGYSNSTDIPGVTNHGSGDVYVIKLDAYGEITWQKMYGGSGEDSGFSIQQTFDGGYIVAGYSNSTDIPGTTCHGRYDYYLIKLDGEGEVIWQKMFGGSGDDWWVSVQKTFDGGYIVAGYSSSTDIPGTTYHGGGGDCYVIKLDADGEAIWQKLYGGSDWDHASSVCQTYDGGYMVVGGSDSTDIPGVFNHGSMDTYAIRLDSDGQILWQQMYGGSGDEAGDGFFFVEKTTDESFIISYTSASIDIPGTIFHGIIDYCVTKIDAEGFVQWQSMYGGSGSDGDCNINQITDGGYILTGVSDSTDIYSVTTHGGYDVYIINLDAFGEIIWHKMYGGSGDDLAYSTKQTTDGGYVVAGQSASTDIPEVPSLGNRDVYVIKLDSDGNL